MDEKMTKRLLILSLLLTYILHATSQRVDSYTVAGDLQEDDAPKVIKFTKAEKQWLRKAQPVHYVFDPDWRPFEWSDALDAHTGIIFDIIRLIEARSGIDFVAEPSRSWTEAINKVKSGKVPMFSAIGVTQARKKYLSFSSRPLFATPYVLVSRLGEDYLDGFADTTDKRVATISTSTIAALLKEKRPQVKFTTLPTIKDGFDSLREAKIDVFVVNAASAHYYIKMLGYDDLKIAYKTRLTLELRIAIRKEMPKEVLSIIEKSMQTFTKKEISAIFHKWTQRPVQKETDWLFFGKLLGMLVLIVLFLLWNNRKLHKMVRLQTSKLQQQRERLEELLASFEKNVIASRSDTRGNITYVSEALCQKSGFREDELLGRSYDSMRHPSMSDEIFDEMWRTIISGKTWQGEMQNLKKDGSAYVTDTIITPEYTADGRLDGYSAILQDITDKKRVERLSITDGLTNIYNRRHFNDLFPRLITALAQEDTFIALMILDVDDFKQYNDTYGHQKGDRVLITIATTLSDTLQRADDHCFRLGGEEFGVLFRSRDPQSAEEFANTIREKIERLGLIHEKSSVSEYITVSVGLVCEKAALIDDVDSFYKKVDDLLYEAKYHGKNTVRS